MFEKLDHARIFGIPPGADFPSVLVAGILARTAGLPPEYLARIEIIVNTNRMRRRIVSLFESGDARLLPRIRLVTDFATQYSEAMPASPIAPLRRRFELAGLIGRLLDQEPDLAPRSALYDLADSLALLLDEMHDEGVTAKDIENLDVSDRSGHWERSQKFLEIVSQFTGEIGDGVPDIAARQRQFISELTSDWIIKPPSHPIIIAGSTGSRGSTSMLMDAIARLPLGAAILPGFDFDLPSPVWDALGDPASSEGHPQFRLRSFVTNAGISKLDVQDWHPSARPPAPCRNRIISLALRPAPITNQWMSEGPELIPDIASATHNVTLLEAPSGRIEAMAIAMMLRQAAQGQKTAALVTPDKVLSRRVRSALDRWRIEPDISAGDALETTAPGRLFRHVSDLFGVRLGAEDLLVLLKHPLVNSHDDYRARHLEWTRALEHELRQKGPAFPTADDLVAWAGNPKTDTGKPAWAAWISDTLSPLSVTREQSFEDHLHRHQNVVEQLLQGPDKSDSTSVWTTPAGKEMARVLSELLEQASHAGHMSPRDYGNIFLGVLRKNEVRDPVRPHPNIMIWGTLEARVQGADLVILGGLNEGTWPQAPSPDPWLNRNMRLNAGLLLPERPIGLSAHDFQQAVAANNVVLSRSVRDDEAPSVPSRWLSRITNLLGGLSEEGVAALIDMKSRGQAWVKLVEILESPPSVDPEPRPAPAPPISVRPKSLSVTAITRLIRDPYAIYAKNVLKLMRLNPLRHQADARLRGIVLHRIMHDFIDTIGYPLPKSGGREELSDLTKHILAQDVPWPTARLLWNARFSKNFETLLAGEKQRQAIGVPILLEEFGMYQFTEPDFKLTAIVDRIDISPEGHFIIYDYKSGKIPTAAEMKNFEKQLLLEALMFESGSFEIFGKGTVREVAYIGLGSDASFKKYSLDTGDVDQVRKELIFLISEYQNRFQGYASRRAMAKVRYAGDYDHLARFGEWDDSNEPTMIKVGK